MTPAEFLDNFGHLAEAPNGVRKLRELILQLAVRGQLVPQDPNEEPSNVFLEEINAEKKPEIADGRTNRLKSLQEECTEYFNFQIPPNWTWVTLSDVLLELQTGPFGSNLHKSEYIENGTPVINPSNIREQSIVPDPKVSVGSSTLSRLQSYQVRTGDIILARRGEMGRCAVISKKQEGWLCGTGSLILRISDCIFRPFLIVLMHSEFVRRYLLSNSVGATMNNLNQSILVRLPCPLPPLPEQERIVAKVDQLMALCDELEQRRDAATKTRRQFQIAALDQLTNAESVEDLQVAWGRVQRYFDALAADHAGGQLVRQAILDLGAQGRLMPQVPSDEPISPQHLDVPPVRRQPKGRTEASLGPVTFEEAPMELPANWVWARLFQLCVSDAPIVYGILKPGPDIRPHGVPYVRPTEIKNEKIDLSNIRHTTSEISDQFSRSSLQYGDLIYTIVGTIGSMAVVPRELDGGNITQTSCRLRLNISCIETDFLRYVLKSRWINAQVDRMKFGTAVTRLNLAHVRAIAIPLPPLTEQRRIVAKVDQLMALCDELEQQLAQAATTATRYTEAACASLITGKAA